MTRIQRAFSTAGAVLCFVTASLHMFGHLQGYPPPRDEAEATLQRLMTDYRMDVLGMPLTMRQLVDGFSISYGVLLAWVGLTVLVVSRGGVDRPMGPVRAVSVAGAAAHAIVSYRYFPLPPTVFAVLILLCFAGACVPPGRRSRATTG